MPVVLVPMGSTEQHGPHLPVATDAIVAAAVALEAAPHIGRVIDREVIIAPTIPYGASGEHQGFPGTISIGHEALAVMLIELVRSTSAWAHRIVFVNGHGGNMATLSAVVDQMRDEKHTVSAVGCAPETSTDAHAGYDETSVMLFLRPDLVDMARAEVGNTAALSDLLPALMAQGMRPVTANGVLGDPRSASAEAGRRIFAELVDRVVREASHG